MSTTLGPFNVTRENKREYKRIRVADLCATSVEASQNLVSAADSGCGDIDSRTVRVHVDGNATVSHAREHSTFVSVKFENNDYDFGDGTTLLRSTILFLSPEQAIAVRDALLAILPVGPAEPVYLDGGLDSVRDVREVSQA